MVRSAEKLTLDTVKKSPKVTSGASSTTTRLTDFMTKDERAFLHHVNAVGKIKRKQFDQVDAYMAEIIGRFGYDAYLAWNRGDITTKRMNALLAAERAREVESRLSLEIIVKAMVQSCIKLHKGEKRPKGPKFVEKIIRDEIKRAKGVL